MNTFLHSSRASIGLAFLLLLGGAAQAAESLAGSSAAGGSSASSAASSASDSVSASSNSSTRVVAQAEGRYRVAMIAPVPDHPHLMRVTLEQNQEALQVRMPRAVVEKVSLAPGVEVMATQQSYGVRFSRADQVEAFFLVIRDEVHREFAQTPVRL